MKDIGYSKFGKKPKTQTIESVHDLWVRAKDRSIRRRKIMTDFIDEIVKEIPKDEKGKHVVYFYRDVDKIESDCLSFVKISPTISHQDIYCYTFDYDRDYKCYGHVMGQPDLKTRDERLIFILSNEKSFEMGQKFRELDIRRTWLEHKVFRTLWDMVQEKLRIEFKNSRLMSNDIFILNISDKKYYIQVDERSHPSYPIFHMRGECKGLEIKL